METNTDIKTVLSAATMLSRELKKKEDAVKEDNQSEHHKLLEGYDAFRQYVDELHKDTKIVTYFLFEGKRDSSGKSWCSDCNEAEPFIEAAWKKFKTINSEFVCVDVGDRTSFKDNKCPFRTDKELHILNIPTLIRWKTQRRLGEHQLSREDLLEMFFTEDD